MNRSTLQPFAPGDVFVGATVLDDPADDHAGRGRILQYDASLAPKGILWLEDTTHLVGGLSFDARGRLWAFDWQSFAVCAVHPDGRVERRDFGARPYSNVSFARDGTLYLGEHVAGDTIRPEIEARLETTLPHMPGTQRFGDGHVWHFRDDGTFIKEYATQTHGGLAGFLGVTHAVLSPDESILCYCSETGPRLMRYDLKHDRQLPDLQSFPDGQREMFFGLCPGPGGVLYALRGSRLDAIAATGTTVRTIPLPGSGWATIALAPDGRTACVGNFFTGELGRIDLDSGARLATVQTGAARSLAGLAIFAAVPVRKRVLPRKKAQGRRRAVQKRTPRNARAPGKPRGKKKASPRKARRGRRPGRRALRG
ncbi:MAG: hypothetical protein IPI06_07675 [Gammaproteobacteria bacterium]|nr:hypothetical protein [Gammaproteobacteria bacterium]